MMPLFEPPVPEVTSEMLPEVTSEMLLLPVVPEACWIVSVDAGLACVTCPVSAWDACVPCAVESVKVNDDADAVVNVWLVLFNHVPVVRPVKVTTSPTAKLPPVIVRVTTLLEFSEMLVTVADVCGAVIADPIDHVSSADAPSVK